MTQPKGPWFNPDNRDYLAESEAEDEFLRQHGFDLYWLTLNDEDSMAAGVRALERDMTLVPLVRSAHSVYVQIATTLMRQQLTIGPWTNVRLPGDYLQWYLALSTIGDAVTVKMLHPELFRDEDEDSG